MATRLASTLSPTNAAPREILGAAALLSLVLFAALFPWYPGASSLGLGTIADRTVVAPRDLSYESAVRTERARAQTVASVPDVMVLDTGVRERQIAELDRITLTITRAREDAALSESAKETAIRSIAGTTITQSAAATLVRLTPEAWAAARIELQDALGRTLVGAIPAPEVEAGRERALTYLSPLLDADRRSAMIELLAPLVVPTLRLDSARTQTQRDQAAANVRPVVVTYQAGQPVIEEGALVDAEAVEALQRFGIEVGAVRWPAVAASGAVAATLALVGGGLLTGTRRPLRGTRDRLLFAALLATAAAMAKFAAPFISPDDTRRFLGLALPLAAAPIALAALLVAGAAAIMVALLFVAVGFAFVAAPGEGSGDPRAIEVLGVVLALAIGSFAGVVTATGATSRQRVVLAGVVAGIATALLALAMLLVDPERRLPDVVWLAGTSIVGGVGAGLIALGLVAMLSRAFGVVTRVQLMELAQLSHPLLRRLQDEAPGTFQHAMLVGNLAERAADRISADALLVRVGAYYHDVGKLFSPGFFVENFGDDPSPHDQLDPQQSNRVIQQHVSQGVEFAAKAGLPDAVTRFIPEHHGTRVVAYFYRRAAAADPHTDIEQFRYPGPRPQSRETALVMIADACEATVRSIPDRSTERIRAVVEEVVRERIEEGQFDECPITLADLRVVIDSYAATLNAVFHPRVEYPEPSMRERAARGDRSTPAAPSPQLALPVPDAPRLRGEDDA